MVEWGAKTIPEGGFYAVPARRSGDGVVILGDAAGLVDVPSLKGIHYAMQSGMCAARAIFHALRADDPSAERLAAYDRMVDESFIMADLYRTRNMRLAFTDGFYRGGLKAGLMTLTGGRFPGGKIAMKPDAAVPRLVVGRDVPAAVAEFYAHLCPAGVYELADGVLRINAPNCVDCKATDVLGPRWTPREGGSGPRYKRM